MAEYSLNFQMDNNIGIIRITGSIDAHTAPNFNKNLQECISKTKKIIIDLSKLEYISTAGLGVLIATYNELIKDKGNIILVGMSDKIKKVFDTMGFSKIFKIGNNINDAKKLL